MAQVELGTRLVTLDSSAIVAFLDRQDKHHESIGRVVEEHLGSLIIPAPVIAEVAYFIERDLDQSTLVHSRSTVANMTGIESLSSLRGMRIFLLAWRMQP